MWNSPHYFDLFDVMQDHSSSKPEINLEELDEIIAEHLTTDSEEDSLIDNNNDTHPSNQNNDNTESQENSCPNSWSSNNTTVDVVATTTDVVPAAIPLTMKWEKDTEKRSTTSKKKHHKCQDDMGMDTFFKYQKEASSPKKASNKESKQHGKEMEKIEEMKATK